MLDQSAEDLTPLLNQSISPLPSKRQIVLEIPEVRFDISDLWQYGRCGLMQRMGERNSSLGKVMPVSQQLIYETELIATLSQCIKEFGNSEEHRWLQELKLTKMNMLPLIWHNLLWGSQEFRTLMRPQAERQLPRQGRQTAVKVLQTLVALKQQTIAGTAQLTPSFELILGQLQGNHYLGQLRKDSHNALIILNKTNELLENNLHKVTCIDNKPSAQAKQLKQYLFGYYAKESQPALTQLLRELTTVIAIVPPLFAETDNTAGNYFSTELGPEGLHSKLLQSIRRYQQNWQQMLQRCGLTLQT
jgi:hypothetical protein